MLIVMDKSVYLILQETPHSFTTCQRKLKKVRMLFLRRESQTSASFQDCPKKMTHTQSNFYSSIFLAARPKTLPAAIIPILLGSFLAYSFSYESDLILLISILLSTLCIQIATNFFNDALDDIKGADTLNRICLLYTSPSPRDRTRSRMPSSA